jgi:hypothetical protein
MGSRLRQFRGVAGPRPLAIRQRSWAIFHAYCYEERPLAEIGRAYRLSAHQVRRIVDEVKAYLGAIRGGEAKPVGFESPVEDLGLPVRTRNALRGVGCNTVQDVLRLDLSSVVRGLGPKTKHDLLRRLERAGFHHPALDEQPAMEIRNLERSLERMRRRIDEALAAVAKEIRLVKLRLRKQMAIRGGRKAVAPAGDSPLITAGGYRPETS